MILLAAFLLIVLAVPLLGGRYSRLSTLSFEKGWLITAAMVIQIPITTFAAGWLPASTTGVIHLITYLFAFAFVWANRSQLGMVILVAGALCNFAAIAANGGVMPASASARESAGIVSDGEFSNSDYVEDANLAFLGDVFAIPESWPFSNVFSIGDVLLILGGGYVVHRGAGSLLFPARRRKMIVDEFWQRFEDEHNVEIDESIDRPKVGAVAD